MEDAKMWDSLIETTFMTPRSGNYIISGNNIA